MNRLTAYLLGPELIWLAMLGLTGIIVTLYQPMPANDHDRLLNFGYFLPVIGVLLAFSPLYWGPGSHWWWLLRIILASLIGAGLLVGYLCEAARYNDSRDSGIGTAFMLFIGLGWFSLIGMVIIAALCFLAKWPFLTVYKWILIVIGAFVFLGTLIGWIASFGSTKNA
ncbi:hypothetical protein [Spirosoma sp. KNUC1025]|uniref:hypothetical protein n=1 Tax=Spirosoma sp. KNUC1025 TaxID=2894082 RepID=UPI0038646D24|nr:hypothetical protein LN737_25690 [Spirosoma sp. KNUC1025]